MSFMFKGCRVTLRGDPSLHSQTSTLNQLQEERSMTGLGFYFDIVQINRLSLTVEIPIPIEHLLGMYVKGFAEPTKLPPLRYREHTINMIASTSPISVRPYRYPHAYKEEMEKIESQMLTVGLIRTSRSPFSSPVLLVRKKATIPDKFPIPMIDQLLDELEGTCFFSKMWT